MRYKVEFEDLKGNINSYICQDAFRISNIIFIRFNNKKELEINFNNLKWWKRTELEEI